MSGEKQASWGEHEFSAFAEHLPDLLEEVFEVIRDDWDGSPLLVIAQSAQEIAEAYILTATGEERLNVIVEAFQESERAPIAAALVVSSPLVTGAGLVHDRALLVVYCADSAAREEWLFHQLGAGPDSSAEISALPENVDVQVLPSAATDLIRHLLIASADAVDESGLDPRSLERALDDALSNFPQETGGDVAPSFISDAVNTLERDLLNNMFGWSGEPCVVQWSGRHQLISPGMLQGETEEAQLDAMRQLFEMDLPSSVLIARLVEGQPIEGVIGITILDCDGSRSTFRSRFTRDADDAVTLAEIMEQEGVEVDRFETVARQLMKVSAKVLSGRLAIDNPEWRRAATSVQPDT